MARTAKLIVLRHSGDELLFAGLAGLTAGQKKVVRSLTRKKAVLEFGEARVREAEQTGLALKPRATYQS